jgi:hypothetical protein
MKHFLSALLLVALVASTGLAQDKIYRYEKGKEYRYILEETGMTIQEVQGQTMTSNNESMVSAIISINDVLENGNMAATAKIENALIVIESGNNTQSLGSDFVGKSVTYVFDAMGDVVEVDTNSTKTLDGPAASVLQRITDILPKLEAGKLSEGSSWEKTRQDTSGRGDAKTYITTNSSYKVKGTKKLGNYDCLMISTESEAKINGTMVRGDQEMNIQGTQESTGTIYYAPAEGLLVEIDMETTSDQVIVVSSMNMRVPVTSNSTLKLELAQK